MKSYTWEITFHDESVVRVTVDAITAGESLKKAKNQAEDEHPGKLVWSTSLVAVA